MNFGANRLAVMSQGLLSDELFQDAKNELEVLQLRSDIRISNLVCVCVSRAQSAHTHHTGKHLGRLFCEKEHPICVLFLCDRCVQI